MTRSITSTTMFIFSDYRFRTCCSHSEALPLSPTRCLTRCGFRGGTHTFSWYIAWHWSREEKNWFLMFSFAPNTLRHRTCFDYNTKQNKKWKTTETSLSFFLYSPESCVPTTAEHTKGPLEQNYLSSVTRRNPTGIFVKFEINLERWMRYISRGAISPARADLLLVDDLLLFLF